MVTSSHDQVVVVGSGLAGMVAALSLAPMPVLLVTEGRLGRHGSTTWAQGGIASALADGDQPAYHKQDTIAAGAGLSDHDVVDQVVRFAPDAINQLLRWGVSFDENPNGTPNFALEGAHSRPRILHVGGDRTGAALIEALQSRVETSSHIEVVEEASVTELVIDDDCVRGVWLQRQRRVCAIAGRAVVLATGGIGGLYASTTNPLGSWGSGLRLAARAGARLRDLEFVQFHPTAIDLPFSVSKGAPLPLASEAIRGEGAVLVDDEGSLVMTHDLGGNLASRDKVAQAITSRRSAGRQTFLDARGAIGAAFPRRFPEITAHCREFGIDPVTQLIPVRPAAHYHMGGIETDHAGATSLGGLWAVGEVASTGMHGANRLASNSLLEAVAFALFAAKDIQARVRPGSIGPDPSTAWSLRPPIMTTSDSHSIRQLRDIMDCYIGVARNQTGLSLAIETLAGLQRTAAPANQLSAMGEVAQMIARTALSRQQTIGAHVRSDDTTVKTRMPLHQSIFLAGGGTTHFKHEWSR